MENFKQIISLWPTQREFAETIGVDHDTARKWAQRDSIPPEWWIAVSEALEAKGKPMTVTELAALRTSQKVS